MDRLSQNPTIAPATSEIPLRKFHPTSSIRPFSLWIYGKLLRTFPQPPQARRRLTTFDQDLTELNASHSGNYQVLTRSCHAIPSRGAAKDT